MTRIRFLVDGEGVYAWVDSIITDRNEKVVPILNLNSVSALRGLALTMYNPALTNEAMLLLVVHHVSLV